MTRETGPLRRRSTSDKPPKRCIDCGLPSNIALNPSGLFCTACEQERRARINASMAEITAKFDRAASEGKRD